MGIIEKFNLVELLAILLEQSYNLEKCGRDRDANYGGTDLLKAFSNN